MKRILTIIAFVAAAICGPPTFAIDDTYANGVNLAIVTGSTAGADATEMTSAGVIGHFDNNLTGAEDGTWGDQLLDPGDAKMGAAFAATNNSYLGGTDDGDNLYYTTTGFDASNDDAPEVVITGCDEVASSASLKHNDSGAGGKTSTA